MSDTISRIGAAISFDLRRAELISHNISNVTTEGYKQKSADPSEFSAFLNGYTSGVHEPVSDNRQGILVATGDSSTLAFNGEGHFMLQDESERMVHFVRTVRIQSDKEGRLIGSNGMLLLGDSGTIYTGGIVPVVSERGEVIIGGNVVARLALIDSPEIARRTVIPVDELPSAIGPFTGKVLQGFIEKSNVEVNGQMIELMQITKHLESNQRSVSTLDSMIGAGINEVGKR